MEDFFQREAQQLSAFFSLETGAAEGAGAGAAAGALAALPAAVVVPQAERSTGGAGGGGGGGGGGPRRKKSMAAGRKGGAAVVPREEKLTTIRKSCDFCNKRKKKCDGDGVNPCSLCVHKKQESCIYSRRRPQTPRKPRKPPAAPTSTSPAATGDDDGSSRALALSHPSLKRCRMSASLATGLVGTQENSLLNEFFSCMGFLPLTCQSTIRSAMVNLLISAQMSGPPELDRIVGHAYGADSLVSASAAPALSSQHNDPATCMFWCAVALGGLTQGRPIHSVAGYIRLAENAMAGCLGAAKADVARAWALMAYLYGFCGDSENFYKCQQKADIALSSSSSRGEGSADQSEFVELVRHANGLCLFYGDSASSVDVESYLSKRKPHPQMNEAATGGNICRFVMQSYQRFGQAFLCDAFNQSAQIEEECPPYDDTLAALPSDDSSLGVVGYGGGGGGGPALTVPVSGKASSSLGVIGGGGGGSSSGSGGPAGTVAMSGSRAMDPPTGSANMKKMMEQAMPEYERLEETVDGSDVRGGIGGLMINCTSVVLKAVQKDLPGAVERISRCVEVLARYPGVIRFPMGLHMSHLLISALAAMDEHELFDELRAVYNPMRPPGSAPFPPLEEWQGIEECCNHVYCRAIESRFQKPKQAIPVPEVCQNYDAVEVGPKHIEEYIEGWNTIPLPSPAPAFDVMGMGEPLDTWPLHRASLSSTDSEREERDFAAAAEFSQALGAIMTPSVIMTPAISTTTNMTPAVMTSVNLTPAVMNPAVMTPSVMTPENMTPVAMTPANMTPANLTPARHGCRTRPTAFLFDARSEKARSAGAAPTTIPRNSTSKPPLGDDKNDDDIDDGDDGDGGSLGPTPGTTVLPFDGKFLEKRADSGDIDGGNAIDSVAEVAEHYLLAGPEEEAYRGYEDAVAADSFLETTLAMLHPQTGHQREPFVFGTEF